MCDVVWQGGGTGKDRVGVTGVMDAGGGSTSGNRTSFKRNVLGRDSVSRNKLASRDGCLDGGCG
jgi:hypothetical protein